MKRSEALELIKNAVEHSDKKPESIANLALGYLEAQGMLPPKVKVESIVPVTHPETGVHGEFRSWTYKSEWKPENE